MSSSLKSLNQKKPINIFNWPSRRSITVEVSSEMSTGRLEWITKWVNKVAYRLDRLASYHKLDGITASQIDINRRILLVNLIGGQEIFVNPTIISTSGEDIWYEQCVVAKERYLVLRPQKVTVEYFNDKLKRVRRTFSGNEAKLICHLIDHLDLVTLEEQEKKVSSKLPIRPQLPRDWSKPYRA